MGNQIHTVSRSCYYNIRHLRLIRALLSHQGLSDNAYGLVLSRLHYCNVLYAGALTCLVKHLQIFINTGARVVSGRSCFSPNTGYVCDVQYWLPAAQRIDF